MPTSETTCPTCGAALGHGLQGLCPHCLWGDSVTADDADLIPGHTLGEELARGGMGIVYRAGQQEPRRTVAVKMLRPHLLEQQVMKERFRQEATAAAALQHPGILPVYQVGETDGVPWFTMMLAEGGTLSARRERYHGRWRETAQLMAHLSRAVGHAHERGVLHRDLKPGNILFDAADRAYVCDFGLAKVATAGESTPDWTLSVQLLGTPHYLPPEVAAGTQKQTTTAGDIYSLGVILYELLAGHPPFDADNVPALLRKIADEEPSSLTPVARPVARRSGTGSQHLPQGSTLTEARQPFAQEEVPADAGLLPPVSERRATGGRATGAPPADLAAIAMKCLEKSPERRYTTAVALAEDLDSWLAGKPVIARRLTRAQKLGRWVRRNPVTTLLCALLSGTLASGVAMIIWKNRQLSDVIVQRTAALTHSEQVSGYLTTVFKSPDPLRDGYSITVAETLDNAVGRLDELSALPSEKLRMQAIFGSTYAALGLYEKAIPLLEKVRDYLCDTAGPESSDSIGAVLALADAYDEAGRQSEAVPLKEEVLRQRRHLLGAEHPDTLTAMHKLAWSYYCTDRVPEARDLEEEVFQTRERILGTGHLDTFEALANLAQYTDATGGRGRAMELRRKVLGHYRQVLKPDHPKTIWALTHLAFSCDAAGNKDEALALRREALAAAKARLGPEHSDTLYMMDCLAISLAAPGRTEDGVRLLRDTIALYAKTLGPDHFCTLRTTRVLADLLWSNRRLQEALPLLLECVEQGARDYPYATLKLASALCWLHDEEGYRANMRLALERAPKSSDPVTVERLVKACCLRPLMDAEFARTVVVQAGRAVELDPGNQYAAWFHLTLGMAQFRAGDWTAAEMALRKAEAGASGLPAFRSQLEQTARFYRCMTLQRQSRITEARELFRGTVTHMKPLPKSADAPLTTAEDSHDDLILWLACKEADAMLTTVSEEKPGN